MASSRAPETPLTIWGALARMRNISRLVLAAIEREDLDEIECLSREGGALADVVRPVLESMRKLGTLPPDLAVQVEDLSKTYQTIVSGLVDGRERVALQLQEVRRTRLRLRRVGLEDDPGPSLLNRTT